MFLCIYFTHRKTSNILQISRKNFIIIIIIIYLFNFTSTNSDRKLPIIYHENTPRILCLKNIMNNPRSIILIFQGSIDHSWLENRSGWKSKIYTSYLCKFFVLNKIISQLIVFQRQHPAVILAIHLFISMCFTSL